MKTAEQTREEIETIILENSPEFTKLGSDMIYFVWQLVRAEEQEDYEECKNIKSIFEKELKIATHIIVQKNSAYYDDPIEHPKNLQRGMQRMFDVMVEKTRKMIKETKK